MPLEAVWMSQKMSQKKKLYKSLPLPLSSPVSVYMCTLPHIFAYITGPQFLPMFLQGAIHKLYIHHSNGH